MDCQLLYKTRDCLLLQTWAMTGGQQTRHSLWNIDVTLATSHSFTAWLKLSAEINTEEGQRKQHAEGSGERNKHCQLYKTHDCLLQQYMDHDWWPADKALTVGHRRDFGHVPVFNHPVGAVPLAAWNDAVSIFARIACAGFPRPVGSPMAELECLLITFIIF
jgi:hypothetical protein